MRLINTNTISDTQLSSYYKSICIFEDVMRVMIGKVQDIDFKFTNELKSIIEEEVGKRKLNNDNKKAIEERYD